MVLRFHGAGMTGETRVLLIVLADRMDQRRNASVPRAELAKMFDVDPRRITERVQIAHELGLLDTVVRGRPGITAVYQGLFPTGVNQRVKTKKDGAHVRTKPHGAVERTMSEAEHGAHVRPASSKRNSSEALMLSPAVEDLEDPFDDGLALAPTALSRAAAEDTRVRATDVDRAEDEGVRTPQATPHIEKTKPIPLPDGWTPNAQHRVMIAARDLDLAEVLEAFEGTYQAYYERRRNWDTTFARFILDFHEDGACHWGVA